MSQPNGEKSGSLPPAIEVKGVSKSYGQTAALNNVSFSVPSGVVFALLGENGAGKSTLIRTLTGMVSPDSGESTVLGHPSCESSMQIRRRIGYVSDAPALYDWMKAEEIGWFTSAFYEEDAFSMRYLELLVELGIPSGVRIKQMSKGQRAKVALALATAHNPDLLILDEPTSGLDPMVRRQFLESMVKRAAVGKTVLLSSHQIDEVERVADWIAIMHSGQLKIVAPLDELKEAISIVTVTLDQGDAAPPIPQGEVLRELKNGRQTRYVMQDLEPNWQASLEASPGVTGVQVAKPTLEEIFVAMCDESISNVSSFASPRKQRMPDHAQNQSLQTGVARVPSEAASSDQETTS